MAHSEIESLQSYYNGFYIEKPVGNNAFSFAGRRNKRIYVPPLIEGDLDSLAVGDEIAFSEVVDGREINTCGLKHFVHMKREGKEFFIFDNHNHAFFFWLYALKKKVLRMGETLVHVDQHKDLRLPAEDFSFKNVSALDLRKGFEYANFVLNVGSFIKPAMALGIFRDVKIIDSRPAFADPLPDQFVLDLDMDIFSTEMRYIDEDYKIEMIQRILSKAKFVTIATSPFFMDQNEAVRILYKILQ